MNGVCIGDLSSRDDMRDVEVGTGRRRISDANRFVGKTNMKAVRICRGVNSDSSYAHFPAGAYNAQGDFAPIGNENLMEHKREFGDPS